MYEGGIRVPFLVTWPGVIPAGRVISEPVISLDILSTAAAAAGTKSPDGRIIDGVDLLPMLTGSSAAPPHDALFWRKGDAAACRSGDWKLVMHPDGSKELYDLASDIGEEKDLAVERPEILSAMVAEYAEWESGMVNPPPERPMRRRRGGG
jgi:arylsulfatase A-like enzyme